MNAKKILFSIACIVGVISFMLLFIRDFNFKWVSVNEDLALVRINFLLPMQKDDINEYITIENDSVYDHKYPYAVKWINDNTCEILIKEQSEIKGQEINLNISGFPTQHAMITKNISISIQFKSEIDIALPDQEILIATNQPILVQFNTPINEHKIQQYIQSDAEFIIEPAIVTQSNGEELKDLTLYKFTPKEHLENNRQYDIVFLRGLPSVAGTILKEDQMMTILTDQKPQITKITPSDGSKWIGLYPRMIVESSTPMVRSFLTIGSEVIKGTLSDNYHAVFYPAKPLLPNTTYTMNVHIQSATGENSVIEEVTFTTVPIKEDKLWIEVVTGGNQVLNVYQGNTQIKSFVCSAGYDPKQSPLGTYYTQSKQETYSSESYGANYCTTLTEGIKIHGLKRTDSWDINPSSYTNLGTYQNSLNIILSEDDAKWIYENIPTDTMLIAYPGEQ